jgi:hypothetical protein
LSSRREETAARARKSSGERETAPKEKNAWNEKETPTTGMITTKTGIDI